MILLLSLLFILCGTPSLCLEEDGSFVFHEDFRHFAVANHTVYIATEEKLYQLNHDLTLIHSLTQRGILKPTTKPSDPPGTKYYHRVSGAAHWNTTFRVNVLLPFPDNKSVITCGMVDNDCGYCEILDQKDISITLHKENYQVGPTRSSSGSVSFLVTLKNNDQRDTYILTAIQESGSGEERCGFDSKVVQLHNTDDISSKGGIFSIIGPSGTSTIESRVPLEFVDGFQINSVIYLLFNAPSDTKNNKVRLIWLEDKFRKKATLESLRGATLSLSDGGGDSRLLASSLVSGHLWSGVFSVDGGQTNTQLMVFDISPDLSGVQNNDPHMYFDKEKPAGNPKILRPKILLLRQSNMTSVLAVMKKSWMVFFIGTGDGQLIKLVVDGNYHTACPKILYKSNEDRRVFPRMQLDQVDHKHVYVPFQNEVKRVAVAKCSTHTDAQECWNAHDPYCVWCVAKKRCTFDDECEDSDWLSIPDDFQQKMISHRVDRDPTGQLTLNTMLHVKLSKEMRFACQISTTSGELCKRDGFPPKFPECSCILSNRTIPPEGLPVSVKMRLGSTILDQHLQLMSCPNISGSPTPVLCQQCVKAGCGWSNNGCSWANEGVSNDSVCQTLQFDLNFPKPEISSITPSVVSFYGRNHAVLSGRNLGGVIGVRLQTDLDCSPQESPVWNNTGKSLTFHIPRTNNKGTTKVCALLPDGSCHGDASITYRSSPSCRKISPRSSWVSGGRTITLTGAHLDFVEGVIHSDAPQEVQRPNSSSHESLTYQSPAAKNSQVSQQFVQLKVANETVFCSMKITIYPDPEFIQFTPSQIGDHTRIVIQKKPDELEVTAEELSVWGEQKDKLHLCKMQEKKNKSGETDFFNCDLQGIAKEKLQKISIKFGNTEATLEQNDYSLMFLMLLAVIPCIVVGAAIACRWQRKKLNDQMNRFMEDLELDIRNDIRQGFVDLHTEKADLLENVGAIPFLDYKHFASRIFFPESETLMSLCVQDMGQDVVKIQLDEACQGLSKLLQDQVFLITMVHALEEQKTFTIKEKCALASLLTVALHGNLWYLTEVMEVLLKDLMQQSSNAQPKLLLRRTESIVEKLLTNWMSICLYGFLRESVGQHLYLMVSALSQQIAKGPVDCVTEKALYTLSEDWLLWQAPDFTTVKLQVLFAVGTDGEVSEALEVQALSCDTVEQVKEKILSAFKAKFGFPYNTTLRDARIEYEKNGSFIPLEEVDASSEVVGEVTMLNTLKHYKVEDGATIKVLSRKSHPPVSQQRSVKDDENFSGKYFHLIDPDVEEDQRKNPERKKLKVKEVHLTKLISTKVAVHSFVENLFRSIWGTSHSKPPHAVKYFFNFLDAQADNMKIYDPDVVHIWKTNSLPLRFWINILKNPQFVFDMEKSPHLDGCLSVIAQAFMDSFSLSETQLGKHAPTNKLLYVKDVPDFKKEVKAYYKQIRDPPHVTESQFKDFLREESKKHQNEFNEAAALRELYKYIQRYHREIKDKLDQNGAPTELTEQLQHVTNTFNGLKSCSWN